MEYLFSTKERIKILQTIVYKDGYVSVNSVASQLDLSKGLVSKYFDLLAERNLAKKTNGKITIIDSALVKGIKILLNIEKIDTRIFEKFPFIISVGLYGSCAKGTNTEESDVDLWIKVEDVAQKRLATLLTAIHNEINNAKPIFLTENKIEELKKTDELFYHSLAFGSIILYGDENGI